MARRTRGAARRALAATAVSTMMSGLLALAPWSPSVSSDAASTGPTGALLNATIAYDSATGDVVLFGLGTSSNGLVSVTRIWNGTTWTQLSPPTSPPPMSDESMVFDPATANVVLFGGVNALGPTAGPPVSGDTWTWNGSTWTKQVTAGPLPRYDAGMAYDPPMGRVVLFGGELDSGGVLGDTWSWDGSSWSDLTPSNAPDVRAGTSMAFDDSSNQLVLFGGFSGSQPVFDDTWTWDGTNWTKQNPLTIPPPRWRSQMADDAGGHEVVLYGGSGDAPGMNLGDTWAWNGSNWLEQNPRTNPPPISSGSMTYDDSTSSVVLYGGDTTGLASFPLSDTWIWSSGDWTHVDPPLGYRLVSSDGGVFSYGAAGFAGSAGSMRLNAPIVGIAATPDGGGYWLVASDGGVFSYGDAVYFGSAGSVRLNAPIVSIAATPDGGGYWLVASDGGIFTYGDAGFFGSLGGRHLNAPVVGIAPDSAGYVLAASDGGVFAFGNSTFMGSRGGEPLNAPIVGIASFEDLFGEVPAQEINGYWLVASDGGIFSYGFAPFVGSAGALKLHAPIVGMTAAPDNDGYWLIAADGGVFNYGTAGFLGSATGLQLNAPIRGIAGF